MNHLKPVVVFLWQYSVLRHLSTLTLHHATNGADHRAQLMALGLNLSRGLL